MHFEFFPLCRPAGPSSAPIGIAHGATDDFGYHAIENRVHVRDLHATILHQLGIDHQRFAYRFQGLDMRLTGVEEARVVQEILS